MFHHPTDAQNKKTASSIKGLSERIDGVEAIMRRHSGRFDKIAANLKVDGLPEKEQNSYIQLSSASNKGK